MARDEQAPALFNGDQLIKNLKDPGMGQEAVAKRGQVLAAPSSVRPHQVFTARMYALTSAEGGRHTPFAADYRPQFYFHTTDVSGGMDLGGLDLVMPGDTLDEVTVTLGKPIALEAGMGFAVREGNRTVAAVTVLAVLD